MMMKYSNNTIMNDEELLSTISLIKFSRSFQKETIN